MSGYRFDRLRLLVVDDNVHMRKLVVTILQAFGAAQIYESADAQNAWAIARETNPDVLFVDWMLEGMSGLELVRMIRTSPASPNPFVPIVMLTGYTQLDNVIQARDAGVNEFLAKPVSVKAILSRLISVIEYPRPYVRTTNYFGPCRRRHIRDEYTGPERRTNETETAIDDAAQKLSA
ncbi:MAG TPA: response regulator [Rhizomicrobium sp.]